MYGLSLTSSDSVWSLEEQRAWALPERLTPSQWAARHRTLSEIESPAEPGPYDPSRAPYQSQIADLVLVPGVTSIIWIASPQIGKSLVLQNVMGWIMCEDPDPIQIVMPDEPSAKETMQERLFPLIDNNPTLAQHKLPQPRAMKTTAIYLDHMHIYVGWAGSPNSLARRAIRWIFPDEVDKYLHAVTKETDPIRLLKHRTTTFGSRSMIFAVTTPTVEENIGWKMYMAAGDHLHFWVPCPHAACGKYQRLLWENMHWPKPETVRKAINAHETAEARRAAIHEAGWLIEDDVALDGPSGYVIDRLRIPDGVDRGQTAQWVQTTGGGLAFMTCPHCKGRIEETSKQQMITRGQLLGKDQSIDRHGVITGRLRQVTSLGVQLPAFNSPWVRWSDIASDGINAKGDPHAMQDFMNGRCAEPFRTLVSSSSVKVFQTMRDAMAARVQRRAEPPAGIVPEWASVILTAADMQKDHFWYVIRAWGQGFRSKLLKWGRVESFADLHQVGLESNFLMEKLHGDDKMPELWMSPTWMLLDTGGSKHDGMDQSRTHQAYQFALTDHRIVCIKGSSKPLNGAIRISNIDYTPPGQDPKDNPVKVQLRLVDSQYLEDVLMHRVTKSRPNDEGHLPDDADWLLNEAVDDDYCSQMSNRHKTLVQTGPRKGQQVWDTVSSGAADHLRQCEVYQEAAAKLAHVDVAPPLEQLRRERMTIIAPPTPTRKSFTTPDGRPFLVTNRKP